MLEEVLEEIREAENLKSAQLLIKDRLVSASEGQKAALAAAFKASRPDIPLEQIFDAFEYKPRTFKSVLAAVNEFHHVEADGRRVYLGFPKLDTTLRGLRPGQVCGLMARASVGKTTLAVNILTRQKCAIFFSLEMPAAEIAVRLRAIDKQETPASIERDWGASVNDPRISEWALEYRELVIVDEAGLTLEDMRDRWEVASRDLGRKIPLIIIDYLGLIRSPGNNSYERTSHVARELKTLAKSTHAVVIVLLQASRAGGTGKERMTMDMARDSGQIEEACDFLLGAWRPQLGEDDDAGEYKLEVLKNRHGRLAQINMYLDLECLRIEEESWS